MSRINSRDRNVRIVAITVTILSGLTVGAAADGGGYHGFGGHHKPVASSYDPAKSVVRDHRSSATTRDTGKPGGLKPK